VHKLNLNDWLFISYLPMRCYDCLLQMNWFTSSMFAEGSWR
jgi:hypothetical protein